MKNFLPKLLLIVLLAGFGLVGPNQSAKACDRSSARLDSVIIGSGFVDIVMTTFIGAGITGTQKGGDAPTRDFGFGFYGSAALAPVSFTTSVTSDTTGATYFSGIGPGALGTRFLLAYLFSGIDFTCVNVTSTCGNRHTDSVQVRVRTNELPDSIRVFGIEGAGNPLGGCYPDADMLLDLTILPVVWAGFAARPSDLGVDLEWTTASESNNDYFRVERSPNGTSFETIGEVNAIGNSSKAMTYNFVDPNPRTGDNFYRITQVDLDGATSESEIRQVSFEAPVGLSWTQFGPNPTRSQLSLGFYADEAQNMELRLIDLQGRIVLQRTVSSHAGINALDLDLSRFATGFYNLQLQGATGALQQRVIKM
ncbi:MAG: T9SS type A sorting domain-containing protein [Bacteroidota bacterium]